MAWNAHSERPARRDAARLAELINRYHAIVRTTPRRKPGPWGFVLYFFFRRHDVEQHRWTLYRIEREIRAFGDPRVHFALNCGALSCPPIREYSAEELDAQLDLATRSYLASGNVVIDTDRGVVHLSRLFLWYRRDFGDPLAFVCRFVSRESASAIRRSTFRITYLPWDWTPTDGPSMSAT